MLYNLLYALYFSIPFRDYSLGNRLWIRLFNVLIPIYFKIRLFKPKLRKSKNNIVVSLTSFPGRIHLVWLVIESMLYQKSQPRAIVLWLSEEEFPRECKLPHHLSDLQKRGLTIRFVKDNIKSHKKYFYAFDAFPYSSVLTIDDDEYYPPNLIAHFIHYQREYRSAIIGSKARKISVLQNRFKPYTEWEMCNYFHLPSNNLLNIGSGGILYPSSSLSDRIFDTDKLKKYALLADDLWIKFANENKEAKNMCIAHKFPHVFIPIIAVNQTQTLFEINVNRAHNDKVLHDLCENLSIDISYFEDKSVSE